MATDRSKEAKDELSDKIQKQLEEALSSIEFKMISKEEVEESWRAVMDAAYVHSIQPAASQQTFSFGAHPEDCLCPDCLNTFFNDPDPDPAPLISSCPPPDPVKDEHPVEATAVGKDEVCYFCGHSWRTRGMVGRVRSTNAPICIECATTIFK